MTYEPPVYPTAIPTQTPETGDLPDRVDDLDWLLAARYNELKKELCAVMTELGTLPKGSYDDVKARLNALGVSYPQDLRSSATPEFAGVDIGAGDVNSVPWTNYTALTTIYGWSSFASGRKWIYYKKVGKLVFVSFHLEGTSNQTYTQFLLPYACFNFGYGAFITALGFGYNNGAALTTTGKISITYNSNIVDIYTNNASGAWTDSGTKIVSGQFWYETN